MTHATPTLPAPCKMLSSQEIKIVSAGCSSSLFTPTRKLTGPHFAKCDRSSENTFKQFSPHCASPRTRPQVSAVTENPIWTVCLLARQNVGRNHGQAMPPWGVSRPWRGFPSQC